MMFYIPGRFGKQCARGKLNQPRGSSALHSLGPLDHLLATINRAPLSQQAPRDMAAPRPAGCSNRAQGWAEAPPLWTASRTFQISSIAGN